MMKLTVKRTLVLIAVMAALLVGGTVRMHASPAHQSAAPHAQQLAWYCPAPPVTC